jgi:hypothetical protein
VTSRAITERERAREHDEAKVRMSDALHAWAGAHRADIGPGAPAWVTARIPVADYVEVEPGRPLVRVQGGATMSAAEWIRRRSLALEGCREGRAFQDAVCGAWTVQPSSCHTRTCPDCEAQRQARAVDIYANIAAERMVDPRFLTLTVRNVPRDDLRPAIRRLRRHGAQLLRRGLIGGGRCRHRRKCGAVRHIAKGGRPELCNRGYAEHAGDRLRHDWRSRCEARDPEHGHEASRGGLAALEVTFNEQSGTWHPHAHLLVDGAFLPWAELRAAWLEITARDPGGASWIVDVRRVVAPRAPGGMQAAIREVVKYATKPSRALLFSPDLGGILAELLVALRGQRLVSAWGSLYGTPADALERDLPERDTVRVLDPDDPFKAWRLPRLCPHAAGGEHVAAWGAAEWAPRAECVRVRAGAGSSSLAWQQPPA